MKRLVVFGLGSGGWILCYFASFYLNFVRDSKWTIALVDGDAYTVKNKAFQRFNRLGNKAEVQKELLSQEFKEVTFQAIPEYVTEENIAQIITEKTYVLLAVDNHATRKLVSDHCGTKENVTLISGGIGGSMGHVQVYIRRNGLNVTPPLTYLHPEIEHPDDFSPADRPHCDDNIADSEPQLLFTSLTTAAMALNAFLGALKMDEEDLQDFAYSEVFLNILNAKVRAEKRIYVES